MAQDLFGTEPPKKRAATGTREWSAHSANCFVGCSNDCRYCYAREMALRFGRATRETWRNPFGMVSALNKKWTKLDGVVMFPTTHDITPDTLAPCLEFVRNILRAGNEVLLVSKPDLHCIDVLSLALAPYKAQLQFRFTIGTLDEALAAYWEPGAPTPHERVEALHVAQERGYRTSVSAEPMLNSDEARELVRILKPHVTDSIWLGMLNKPGERVVCETDEDRQRLAALVANQSPAKIKDLHARLKNDPLVRWKDSIKQIVGLDVATTPGTDQ